MKAYLVLLLTAAWISTVVHAAPVFPEDMNSREQGATLAPLGVQQLNKQAVLDFYEKGFNQKDANAALKYLSKGYIQHNPTVADGPEGLRKFIAFLKEKYPQSHSQIKQIFADGDYVVLHVHTVREAGTRGNAIIDIFRLDQGKIAEHWDVTQPIPEQTSSGNAMF